MKKTIFKVLALTLSVMMLAGCMVACGDKDATYVIGATGPLSGSAASYGLSVQKGAQLAVKEINEAGGLNGKNFSFEMLDDEASGDKVTDTKNAVWTLTVNGSNVTLKDRNGSFVKPKSGNNNGITNGSYNWAWSMNANGTFVFKGVGSDTTMLASNTGSGNQFRSYKTTTVNGNPNSYPSNFQSFWAIQFLYTKISKM